MGGGRAAAAAHDAGTGGEEAALHAEFASERVHGEWFRDSPRILARVRELGGSPTPLPWSEVYYALSAGLLDGTRFRPSALHDDLSTPEACVALEASLDLGEEPAGDSCFDAGRGVEDDGDVKRET